MQVGLYINSSDNNVINKTIELQVTLTAQNLDIQDIDNPVFIFDTSNIADAINYVQYKNQYYYITSREIIDGRRTRISCGIDVLQTYIDSIMGAQVQIGRSEFNDDLFLNDTIFAIRSNRIQQTKTVNIDNALGTHLLSEDNYCFTITTAGKGTN